MARPLWGCLTGRFQAGAGEKGWRKFLQTGTALSDPFIRMRSHASGYNLPVFIYTLTGVNDTLFSVIDMSIVIFDMTKAGDIGSVAMPVPVYRRIRPDVFSIIRTIRFVLSGRVWGRLPEGGQSWQKDGLYFVCRKRG